MISVPGTGIRPQQLSDRGALYRWDESRPLQDGITMYYHDGSELESIDPGGAYWFKSQKPCTLSVSGSSFAKPPVNISLHRGKLGWNQIASPYPYPVKSPLGTVAWRWRAETRDFERADSILEPWQGYWVLVDSSRAMPVDDTPVFVTRPLAKKSRAAFSDKWEWQVQLSLESNVNTDADNYFGFSRKASNGRDEHDAPEPPRMSGMPFVSFAHPEWDEPVVHFASDMRRMWHTDLVMYELAIAPGDRQVEWVRLKSNGADRLEGVGIYMAGPDGIAELSDDSSYAVVRSDKITYRTLFVTSRRNFLASYPTRFSMGAPYPNPFYPNVNIQYTLPYRWGKDGRMNDDPYEVSVTIYDLRGRAVRHLVHRMQAPGSHSTFWNGRNNANSSVAAGTYLCILKAGKHRSERRLTLMR
jgi:hypothetical protein